MNIFLTGERNVGKTTIINKSITSLRTKWQNRKGISLKVGGFQTFEGEEFSQGKSYVYLKSAEGFLDSRFSSAKIALRDKSSFSFKVYTEVFDEEGTFTLNKSTSSDIIIMDELGFMEKDAKVFQRRVMEILDGDIPVLGVVKLKSNDFLDRVRVHPNVNVITVTEGDRNEKLQEVQSLIEEGLSL